MSVKGSILIVDDEDIVRESLMHWFLEDSYEVECAADAEIALRMFQKKKFMVYLKK